MTGILRSPLRGCVAPQSEPCPTGTSSRYPDPTEIGRALREAELVHERIEKRGPVFEALRAARVELRVMERFTPLLGLWETTTLHWSGYRLRNARDWPR